MEMDLARLEEALIALGQVLANRDLHYEIVLAGGASLLLMNMTERSTKDVDVIALVKEGQFISPDPLPEPLFQAAQEVEKSLGLASHWFSLIPIDLLKMGLPSGFMTRMHTRHYQGLTIDLPDRVDQICFKFYASVKWGPESKHFADLLALKPSPEELSFAKSWCFSQAWFSL